MSQKKIKMLCKISEILGYFVMAGGYLGMLFSAGERQGIIMKASTLVLFLGILLLAPQDVWDKRERDESGDFSFQSIVPSIKLCAALLFALYIVIMAWTHY